jgi:UPF0755 protein
MKKIIFLIVIIVTAVVGYIFGKPYYDVYQSSSLQNCQFESEKKKVMFHSPISFKDLGDTLFARQLINDKEAFNVMVTYKKYEEAILLPGELTLEKKWDNKTLVNQLYLMRNQGTVKVSYNNVRNLDDICVSVSNQLNFSYDEISALLKSEETYTKYGFDELTFSTLFIPNTFEFYYNATPQDFLDKVAEYYKTFWNEERKAKAVELNMTQSEITILASIVYEEQKVKFDEQPKIAGLYLNRLKQGWLLQADPTVKFAWNDPSIKRLLFVHLEIDSPYNTYKNLGLPPGPIAIPEPQTIDAVLNYETHNFMYMCAKPEYSGYHNFSKTLDQHNIYAKEYQSWLSNEGIK